MVETMPSHAGRSPVANSSLLLFRLIRACGLVSLRFHHFALRRRIYEPSSFSSCGHSSHCFGQKEKYILYCFLKILVMIIGEVVEPINLDLN